MTPQELKNSILQLAIQGKLVEQRPEEGTAQELYAQIQAEKQRLIKEGKIKKEKPLPEITEDEKPFEIPDGWMWVRLGNCGSWGSGATPSRTNPEYYGGTIPWLKTGDLNDGIIKEIPEYITELALRKTSVRLNPPGSVLMAMYGATIGKLGILARPATTNQACCACIPYSGIYNKYLFFFLLTSRKSFIKMGEGGAQPNISKEKIVNYPMPLPPLAEQKRIVAKIEELLPLVDHYERAWTKLEDFNRRFPEDMKKSILQQAIQGKLVEQRPEEGTAQELYEQIQIEKQRLIKEGKLKKEKPLPEIAEEEKPFEIPEGWMWVKFGSVVNIVSARRVHQSDWKKEGVPFYRAREIAKLASDGFVDNELFISPELYEEFSKSGVPQLGDLMVSAVGTLGKTYVVKDKDKFYYKDASVICLENYGHILPEYLKYIMASEMMMQQIRRNSGGTTVATLTMVRMAQYIFPLPPFAEQERIVERLEELLAMCERLKTAK